MPNLKDYPAGFNPHYFSPLPPKEKFLKKYLTVFEKDYNQYSDLTLPELKANEKYVIDYISDYDDDRYVTIKIVNSTEVDNPNYEKELAQYNNKLAEWKELKERWDKESQKEAEDKEYKNYLKLKKKFEK